jgi:hypothetical protein
MEATAEKQPED